MAYSGAYNGKWILKVRQYCDDYGDSKWYAYAVCSECGKDWHSKKVIRQHTYFEEDNECLWDNGKLSVEGYKIQYKDFFDGLKNIQFYADKVCAPYCECCGSKMDNEFMINERMCMAE